ncbi:FAD/NAD(P)-binding domain-containing protein [Xylaria intraflava]|nr:FAD/NAD(P)-binding domain-containing protein [Xylaria intraflava]
MEDFDCVVVGAGWYGLAAAGQYHATQPDCSLAVYDCQSSLGGTWAKERLYPGLKSNNLLGTYEYPGFPMSSDLFDVEPGKHISGHAINAYLRAYSKQSGISDFIHLNTKVLSAEHQETDRGGWILTIAPPNQHTVKRVFARHLILATGLTSEPFLPHFDGQEVFGGRVFHGKHFQENCDTLKTAKAATIFGATKFAWDAAYAYAAAGVKVNWVVRSSGHGPCWMSPPYVTPLKKWIEKLANRRFLTWFSPCVWGDADGFSRIRNFYHGTTIGRTMVDTFWKVLTGDITTLNGYDSHPDTAKLKPWIEAMYAGTSFSILNYDQDMLELIRSDMIDVHIGEVDHLSPGKVHLADGTEFESDVFLANTGWKHVPPIKLLPEGIEKELGIPHRPDDNAPDEDLGNNRGLFQQADKEILRRFPRLKKQPVWNKNYKPLTEQKGISSQDEVTPCAHLTPYMLYHFIVPPSPRFLRNRDIAFTGMISNLSNPSTAYISGLWISAYFQGKLAIDPAAALDSKTALAKLQYETVLLNRWGKWRYPIDWGDKQPSFIFDFVPYADLLQRDLGLNPHRKKSWFAEMTDAYGPEDYRDINDEWLEKTKA